MREGPTTIVTRHRSCLGCRWHEHRMIATGRSPVRDNSCLHPDVADIGPYIAALGLHGHPARHIGPSDRTPEWCPVAGGEASRP